MSNSLTMNQLLLIALDRGEDRFINQYLEADPGEFAGALAAVKDVTAKLKSVEEAFKSRAKERLGDGEAIPGWELKAGGGTWKTINRGRVVDNFDAKYGIGAFNKFVAPVQDVKIGDIKKAIDLAEKAAGRKKPTGEEKTELAEEIAIGGLNYTASAPSLKRVEDNPED